jgi:hypothetical protein
VGDEKKADGTCRARLTATGYEQIDGLQFDSSDTSAPVVNDTTIRIVFVLMIMAGWTAMLLDVRVTFMSHEILRDYSGTWITVETQWNLGWRS